jgi:ribosomal protein S27AE
MINLIKMEIEEKDVKVKMSVCPECGNAIRGCC